jgi:tetratricopeptide (TPR) repeat protein
MWVGDAQELWGFASPGARLYQAAGDINITTVESRERPGPGLVSVAPPWTRLPEPLRGRAAVSADLLGLLDNPPGHLVVVHGAGGYGKSTLAVWLARRAADRGMRVWWVSAHDARLLADGLREVAIDAGADPLAAETAWSRGGGPDLLWRTLDAVGDRWVLVVDNADDLAALSGGGRMADGTGWLRHPERGLVVVTSREGNPLAWPRGSDLRRLTGLEAVDAGLMLLDLAGDAGSARDAERLGERLGGLPLALRLAGSYLAARDDALPVPGAVVPRTFADYLAVLDDRLDLLDARPGHHDDERDERELITRTWELSLDLLANRRHELARPLLRLLSCFGTAPIPFDLLDARLLAAVPVWAAITPDHLAELLRVLLDFGLVDRADEALTLHRLIRETNRHHAEAEPDIGAHATVLAVLVDAATDGFSISSDNWSRWHMLATHAEAALDLCGSHRDRVAPEVVARATKAAGRAVLFRRSVHDFERAATGYHMLVDIQREILGEHHPDTLATRADLALVYSDQGLVDKAAAELQEVGDLQRQVLGDHHPDTLRTRQLLAGRIGEQGRWAEAERLYRETMELARRELGPAAECTLACWSGLAQALHLQGRVAESEVEYRESLAAFRQFLDREHHGMLATWHGYATVLASQGKDTEAAREFRALLRVREQIWGERAEPTLAARHGLARALRQLGRYTVARDHYRAIIDIGLSAYGETHTGILYSRFNLALVHIELRDFDSARAELTEVLAIQRRVHGDAHPDTLATWFHLATIPAMAGDNAAARRELRDFLAAARPVLGPGDTTVHAAESFLSRPSLPSAPVPPPPSRRERRQRDRATKRKR